MNKPLLTCITFLSLGLAGSQVLKLARGEATHRAAVQKRAFRLDWPLLQQRVAELKAEPWSTFAERRNDEGRDLSRQLQTTHHDVQKTYRLLSLEDFFVATHASIHRSLSRALPVGVAR
jgi:hypothetical protein